MPEKLLDEIDRWVAEGRFANRSDAIRSIVTIHQERERTRKFYEMLLERSKEAKDKPQSLLTLDQIS